MRRSLAGLATIATLAFGLVLGVRDTIDAIEGGCGAFATAPFEGPDGRMWFAELGDSELAAIDTDDALTEYPLELLNTLGGPEFALPSDGNIWVANWAEYIQRVTPTGQVTRFDLQPATEVSNAHPALAVGPDGKVWMLASDVRAEPRVEGFVVIGLDGTWTLGPQGVLHDRATNSGMVFAHGSFWTWGEGDGDGERGFLRIEPDGTVTEVFRTLRWDTGTDPFIGPDGSVWTSYESSPGSTIDVIKTDGATVTHHPVSMSGFHQTWGITAGPQDKIWVLTGNLLYSIDVSGVVAATARPAGVPSGVSLGSGPDGNLWYGGRHEVGRFTTTGELVSKTKLPLRDRLPRLCGVSPAIGDIRGGTEVTVFGRELDRTVAVWFGNARSTDFTVIDEHQLDVVVPPKAPTDPTRGLDVSIETVEGRFLENFLRFRYAGAPQVATVCRSNGPAKGGYWVQLTGTDVDLATTIRFGPYVTTTVQRKGEHPDILSVLVPAGTIRAVKLVGSGVFGTGPAGAQFIYTPLPYSIDTCKNAVIEDPTGKPILPKL